MNDKQKGTIAKSAFNVKRCKKFIIGLCAGLLLSGQAYANESLSSELSHAAGGAVLAGGLTYLADKYSDNPENRGWFGFGVSSLAFVVVELVVSGNTYGSRLDMGSHILGSAVGAFVTDKWILQPVIRQENAVSSYFGVETRINF